MDVQGISLSNACSMDVQGVTISTASAVCRVYAYAFPLPAVWTCRRAGCVPFYRQQYGRAGCTTFWRRTVRHPVRPVPEWTKILEYWTEIQDAGMPMPAAANSMPMPSYGNFPFLEKNASHFSLHQKLSWQRQLAESSLCAEWKANSTNIICSCPDSLVLTTLLCVALIRERACWFSELSRKQFTIII